MRRLFVLAALCFVSCALLVTSSPGKAGGIQVSRSKRLDGAASRPLEPPYGGPTISRASADPACDPRSVASGCSAG
jgi:hypothetical protein